MDENKAFEDFLDQIEEEKNIEMRFENVIPMSKFKRKKENKEFYLKENGYK